MSQRVRLTLLACLAMLPALGQSASADVFGPISLVSEDPVQQAEYAHDSAISSDGRYLAFDGSFGGKTGVWRRDLQSGAVEQVAPGDAERPSISADGRYISFTTTGRLAPGDQNEGPDVYVRDMEAHSSRPCLAGGEGEAAACSFTLASAVDGGEEGLAYGAGSGVEFGSLAAGRTALSADGREVVFVTTAASDLVGPRPPQAPATPAMQVAVRDLDARSTRLMSVLASAGAEPQPVSSLEGAQEVGAVYAAGLAPPRFSAIGAYGSTLEFGASISADGSTVAWLGANVGRQASLLAGETLPPRYSEPLWRRIADGPLTPTMRVTGGSDPSNPECIAGGETALPPRASLSDPCQGPFDINPRKDGPGMGTWLMEGNEGDFVPQLSADGYTVAFLANAPLVASGADFERTTYASDIYLASMRPAAARVKSLRQLSELASGNTGDLATNAPILDFALSADGTQVAFTTKRIVFPLGVPAFASPPASVPGMAELFEADLGDETLTRVSQGFSGGPGEHPFDPALASGGQDPYVKAGDGALSPSFTGDGLTLAFSSTADNLAYGDGNTPAVGHEGTTYDGSDAFVVSRVLFSTITPQQYISPPPAAPALTPTWRLFTTAQSRRDGTVLVRVRVPGAGLLRATARGSLLVQRGSSASARRRRARLRLATVATRKAGAADAGTVSLVLRLAPRYASLASRPGGFVANVVLVFSAPGHRALQERIEVTFARKRSASRASVRASGRGGAGGRAR